MDFNDKRFGGSPGNGRDERDRTVPPDENYYGGYDLDFDNRGRDDIRRSVEESRQSGNTRPYRKEQREYEDIYSAEREMKSDGVRDNENGGFIDPFGFTDFKDESSDGRSSEFGYGNDFGARGDTYERREESYRNDERSQAPQKHGGGKKRKKKNKLLPVIILLLALIILVAGVSTAGISVLGKISYNEKTENPYASADTLMSSSDVTNILLIGVDARSGEQGENTRSDTMMLISLDSANNCIKMTSFLRDTWVYIPFMDKNAKLNAACSNGGYSGVVNTIEYNFGVDIDGYLVTDFELFTVMVDSIGGVEVDVTEAEAKEVTNHPKRYGNVTLEAGSHNLTGEQALAYCRIRKIDTDWVRTKRQRTVMEAIIKKALMSGPVKAFSMVKNIAPYFETDLSKAQLVSVGVKALGCLSGGFQENSCPFKGTWEYGTKGGASVILMNTEKNKEELRKLLYEKQ